MFKRRLTQRPVRSGVRWWGAVAIAWCFAPIGVAAQTAPPPNVTIPPTPTLVVNSSPSGATVLLHGPYELIGQTPWTLTRDLPGVYRVEVHKPGFEPWTGEVILTSGLGASLDVDLNRKSRLRAFARSIIIPGWGQSYAGNQSRGRTFLAAEVLALGGFIWMNELYQNKVDDFDSAAGAYRSARHQDDLPALRRALFAANRDADRAYDRRRIFVTAAIGVYALSAVDALFFSPMGGEARPDGAAGLAPAASEPLARLGWSAELRAGQDARLGLNLQW